MKHELFEELDAWNPKWQTACTSIRSAAEQAGVFGLYLDWLHTQEGAAYLQRTAGTPDYIGAIKAAQEAAERLPCNIGST